MFYHVNGSPINDGNTVGKKLTDCLLFPTLNCKTADDDFNGFRKNT